MAEEIEFENRNFRNFKSHMTLTLTSDDLESHIIVNLALTLTNNIIWFVAALCFIVDVWTNGWTGFIRSSLRRWPNSSIFRGQISKNCNFGGVNRHFQAANQTWQYCYSWTDFHEI